MKKVFSFLSLALFVVLFLGACAAVSTQLDDFNAFQPLPLADADPMPGPEAFRSEGNRVLIQDIDYSGSSIAEELGLASALRSQINRFLEETGSQTVDRSVAQQLAQEVQHAQREGAGRYGGPDVADFAAFGRIVRADGSANRRLVEGTPHCRYSVTVEAELDIYTVPELAKIETVRLRSSRSKNRSDFISCSLDAAPDLIAETAQYAVQNSRADLQTAFAPRGYVIDARRRDDDFIFQISIGSTRNLKEGQQIVIEKTTDYEDPITGDVYQETAEVATGVVTNRIRPTTSWIRVPNADEARQIRKGYLARSHYEMTFGEDLMRMLD